MFIVNGALHFKVCFLIYTFPHTHDYPFNILKIRYAKRLSVLQIIL